MFAPYFVRLLMAIANINHEMRVLIYVYVEYLLVL